jgi:hypothetical protein
VTKQRGFSFLPTQRQLAEAFGVDVRTIRNWKARADKGERHFPFDKASYWPFAPYDPRVWLITARLKKLQQRFIETRFYDRLNASVALHGICPGHITDPEKERLFYHTQAGELMRPEAAQAIQPENELELIAAKLRLRVRTLADKRLLRL